jgi:hypothetical protein
MTRVRRRWGPLTGVLLVLAAVTLLFVHFVINNDLAVIRRDPATKLLAPSSTVMSHGEQPGGQSIDGYNHAMIITIARTPQSRQQVLDFYRQQLQGTGWRFSGRTVSDMDTEDSTVAWTKGDLTATLAFVTKPVAPDTEYDYIVGNVQL